MADNRLLARIARQGGGKLLDMAIGRLLPVEPETDAPPPPAPRPTPRALVARATGTITGKVTGAALLRIATRSVPGAIVIGGGLLAKTLHDRRKQRKLNARALPAPSPDEDGPLG